MKKISAVLLVALLACSMTFAAFTGSAETTFGYDFETGKYGFANTNKVTLKGQTLINGDAASTGEGIYGDIAASFEIKLVDQKDKVLNADEKLDVTLTDDLKISFKLDHAKIVDATNGWELDILNAKGAADYAKSAIDSYKDGNDTKYATFTPGVAPVQGVTFTMDGWTGSFGLEGTKDAKDAKVLAMVETPEFNLEGVKLQGSTALSFDQKKAEDEQFQFAASAKAGYTADKLSVSGAADFGFAKAFNMDIAANVTYDFVATDLYYGMKPTFKPAVENLLSLKNVVTTEPVVVTTTLMDMVNRQDMDVVADIKVVDGLTLKAKAGYEVKAKEMLVGAEAAYAFAPVEGLTVTPKMDDTLTVTFADPDAIVKNVLNVGAEAAYKYDVFTFGAGLNFGLTTESKKDAATTLAAYAKVSADLVDNAEISLVLGNVKLENDLLAKKWGDAKLTCKISF